MTRLFQEIYRREPFWLLVGCILHNRARGDVARPILRALKKKYSIHALAVASSAEVEEIIRPLGLSRARTANILHLAWLWRASEVPRTARDVLKLHGCGKYAADSWAIFIEGRRDVEPTDHALRGYLERGR